jgi:hypothetical protein
MTRNESIRESIAIWTDLVRTGDDSKPDALYKKYENGCPLCEYTKEKSRVDYLPASSSKPCLDHCPYANHFRYLCVNNKSPYSRWEGCEPKDTKKYATKFLAQLKQIPLDPETLFNKYGVMDWSNLEVVAIEEEIREVDHLIAALADKQPMLEAELVWRNFEDSLHGREAEYRLRRAMDMRKEEKKSGK